MEKPTITGVDLAATPEPPRLAHAPVSLAIIRGIAAWARPSLALRFDAAAQTLPYMLRPPKEHKKPNGGARQRRRMKR